MLIFPQFVIVTITRHAQSKEEKKTTGCLEPTTD